MLKILYKLDKIIITEDFLERPYEPKEWLKDSQGNDLPIEMVLFDEVQNIFIDDSLNYYKRKQLEKLSVDFYAYLKRGHFYSEVLQIQVDYRRDSSKNDLQNVEVLIEVMEEAGETETVYKGYEDHTAPATINQLKLLAKEMKSFGVYLYKRKYEIEDLIKQAQTIEEVLEYNWNL